VLAGGPLADVELAFDWFAFVNPRFASRRELCGVPVPVEAFDCADCAGACLPVVCCMPVWNFAAFLALELAFAAFADGCLLVLFELRIADDASADLKGAAVVDRNRVAGRSVDGRVIDFVPAVDRVVVGRTGFPDVFTGRDPVDGRSVLGRVGRVLLDCRPVAAGAGRLLRVVLVVVGRDDGDLVAVCDEGDLLDGCVRAVVGRDDGDLLAGCGDDDLLAGCEVDVECELGRAVVEGRDDVDRDGDCETDGRLEDRDFVDGRGVDGRGVDGRWLGDDR
jgi:hypothetical protein